MVIFLAFFLFWYFFLLLSCGTRLYFRAQVICACSFSFCEKLLASRQDRRKTLVSRKLTKSICTCFFPLHAILYSSFLLVWKKTCDAAVITSISTFLSGFMYKHYLYMMMIVLSPCSSCWRTPTQISIFGSICFMCIILSPFHRSLYTVMYG